MGTLKIDRAMPMRVLLVIGGMHPREGGPPRVVYGSALALQRAGASVEIVAAGDPAEINEIHSAWPGLAEAGVAMHIFPISGPRMLCRSRALTRFVAREIGRFDLVHIHGIWQGCLATAATCARKAGVPTLVSPHGMLDRWQLRQSRLKKLLALRLLDTGAMLREADAILYGTMEEAGEAASLALHGETIAMPNGVEPLRLGDSAVAKADLVRRYPQIASWSHTVLFFSRLHPKKGLDLLVEGFGRIRDEFPDAGLLAVAIPQDAGYEAAIMSRMKQIGSDRIVLITDMVGPAARAVFAAADIFSLPSHQEGFSIAILEAAGAGLPALITDKCHMPEIADVGAGFVVPDTIDGLAEGLRNLLSLDRAALQSMGERGARLVEDEYGWNRIAQRLSDLYARISSARSAA